MIYGNIILEKFGINIKDLFKKKNIQNSEKNIKPYEFKNIGKYKVHKVSGSDKTTFDKMYNREMLTAEGINTNNETLKKVDEWFRKTNNCDPVEIDFYICTGKDMNKYYNLTDDNAYPNNLHILAIDWINICNSPYKSNWRWFSDIVDNNAKREIIKKNPAYKHYNSIYYGNIGFED